MRGSGDGFLQCSDGRHRWGIYGAAGALFVTGQGAATRVLLQERSVWSHEGGTWSIPGGALDVGETAAEGALREASEEVGSPATHEIIAEYVFAPADNWRYVTVVVEVPEPFGSARNFETSAVEWVPVDEVDRRPLHDGFAAAWPSLRQILDERQQPR